LDAGEAVCDMSKSGIERAEEELLYIEVEEKLTPPNYLWRMTKSWPVIVANA
jgi:hypothetical protein